MAENPSNADVFKFDVFLSYSTEDATVMRDLALLLKRDGMRVWFDEWIIQHGVPIGRVIDEGLESSRVLLLAMSRHVLESDWAKIESATLRFRDPTNKVQRFIPLRLDSSEIIDGLKQFAYVDWRGNHDAEYKRLLAACRPPPTGSQQPIDKQHRLKAVTALEGHSAPVQAVAIAENGKRAVSCSRDGTLRVWELAGKQPSETLLRHGGEICGVAITPNGKCAITASDDCTLRLWDLNSVRCRRTLIGHQLRVRGVAISADGRLAVSGSQDRTIRLWDLESGTSLATLSGHAETVWGVALLPDGRRAISGSADGTLKVWDIVTRECVSTITTNAGYLRGLAVTDDGTIAISGSSDKTVRVWNLNLGRLIATLEGHTNEVNAVAVTPDGRRAVSGGDDNTLRVWDLETGKTIAVLAGHSSRVWCVAISRDGTTAISGSEDRIVRVWKLPQLRRVPSGTAKVTRYTNAKVLLVGDSGVGKTGIAYRLTEHCFRESISTDAAWATHLKLPHEASYGDIEREIWLWDFAGQADYRLIHQLYMDETALAVLVFNPQSENPFEGLGQWAYDLQRAARRPFQKLLVAGRIDRGGLMISIESVERFRKEFGFGDYIETSALSGSGCDRLRDAIINHIPWGDIPWTASPRIFRSLKEEIIKLKDENKVLLRVVELKQHLELRLAGDNFTIEQLRAVIGLLVSPGVVWQLEFGDFVLLQPERINSYAAAVIRKVRAHTDEIGCISEEDVVGGKLDYQDMKRLPHDEEQIVLRAMHHTFVDRGLCLREHTDRGALLIFPSYFKRERPELKGNPLIAVSYEFKGPLDEIYATLVVRLHHTPVFDRDALWRFAADFKTQSGKRLGMRMRRKVEGAGQMEIYFEPGIAPDVQVTFMRYVHDHLILKAHDVVRVRHYICPHCNEPVENRRAIHTRLEKGFKDIICVGCEKRVPLWDLIEEKFASEDLQQRVREMEQIATAAIDNESRELILEGHARAITGEAGQIFRGYTGSDHGIDGEIEFKDSRGQASGKRLYLQLKSGDSYLSKRKADGAEIFSIKKRRWADYWQQQAYPVMLVIRTSDGIIRWMDVSTYLRRESLGGEEVKRVVFEGVPFTALNVIQVRRKLFPELEDQRY